VPKAAAHRVASSLGSLSPGSGSGRGQSPALVHDVQLAFAHSTQTVFYLMAAVLAVSFLVSLLWLPGGRVESPEAA
jgi:hypothetical protein